MSHYYYGRSSGHYDEDDIDNQFQHPPYARDNNNHSTPLVNSPNQRPTTTTTTDNFSLNGPFRAQRQPQQSNRNQDDEHTSVQINAIQTLNAGRRNFPILATIYFLWNLIEIVTLSIILGFTWKQRCDEITLRVIIIARIVRNAFIIPIHFRRIIGIPETEFDLKVQSISRLSIMFFFIFSQQWLTDGEQCKETAPLLYWTGISVIVLLYLTILAPLILVLLICLCLPCVLSAINVVNPAGASNEDVEQLPTFQFNPTTYVDPFSDEITTPPPTITQSPKPPQSPKSPSTPQIPTGEMPSAPPLSPSYKSPRQTAASAPSAPSLTPQALPECSICLCEFERGEQLKQLKCGHVYHQACIGNWLNINRTCPVCRSDAITGQHQDISTTRSNALSRFM